MKIYSYVVDHDEGREPNPYFGTCTLCRCKFRKKAEITQGQMGRKNIVESAKAGDWVIGTGELSGRSVGHGKRERLKLRIEVKGLAGDFFTASFRKVINQPALTFSAGNGDPTPPKARLGRLGEGSLLVFYAGLKGWNYDCAPALYTIGFFEIARAGLATSYRQKELAGMFQNNFYFMHRDVFKHQRHRLVLAKGSANSRLLKKAVRISSVGADRNGRALHRLSPEMQAVFGGFAGHTSIQRCPPQWVAPEFTQHAARFISALR